MGVSVCERAEAVAELVLTSLIPQGECDSLVINLDVRRPERFGTWFSTRKTVVMYTCEL